MRLGIAMGCALGLLLAPAAARAEAWQTAAPGPGQVAAAQIDATGAFLMLVSCSGDTGLYVLSISTEPANLSDPGGAVSLSIELEGESFEFPVKYANNDGRAGVVLGWDANEGDDFYFDMLDALKRQTAPVEVVLADKRLSFDPTGVAAALEAVERGCI
jgi:hypothetical protein